VQGLGVRCGDITGWVSRGRRREERRKKRKERERRRRRRKKTEREKMIITMTEVLIPGN
jgi:hypothetical protein